MNVSALFHSDRHPRPRRPMIILILTVIALAAGIFLPAIARAETASADEMTHVCENWLSYMVAQAGAWGGVQNPQISDVRNIIVNDTLVGRFYFIRPTGYVVVPVLKELAPVKAYSDENSLDIEEADGFALLLRQVLQSRTQLYVEVYGSLDAVQPDDEQPLYDVSNRRKWDAFDVSPKDFDASADKDLMAPMDETGPLLTSAWHQGYPYNALCPMGDGGRCAVGCVATAAAQIMYYHQWPPVGEGSYSYYWGGDNSCGGSTPGQTLSADFSDPYVYDNSVEAVSEISYEMGVAFRMDYGRCGSGAYTMQGATVFPTYFRYDPSAQAVYRSDYNAVNWFSLIKDNINRGLPILYRIYSHAIVCDGWRVSGSLNQYHFNYGWGGSNNAWYTVDHLYCPWSGCDPMVEAMVINIIPLSGRPWLREAVFTDSAGDGDGQLEAGETIEMSVRIANYGVEPITDVTLNLSIDDETLSILNGSAYLGTINPDGSSDNSGAPFTFSIPADYIPRIDSFWCEITWNGGTSKDTVVVTKAVGRVNILLVDDDQGGDVNYYYEQCLQNMSIPYDIVNTDAGAPDSSYLDEYDIVIWFTGDYFISPLSLEGIAAMKGFLDAGGKLFLTGQHIASELMGVDMDFLNNYLKTSYQSVQSIEDVPVLEAEAGCQVFDGSEELMINGPGGASNQRFPDLTVPLNGSVAELRFSTYEDYGAISYSGDNQLVFFSFGFEAIENGDTRWQNRDSTMADILRFFAYQRPNQCPSVTGLTVSPGQAMHLLDHTPVIAWTYADHEATPEAMYQVQVSRNAQWSTVDMWDSGPVAGSDLSMTYDGSPLEDGVQYYVRVRASDGALWSNWQTTTIRMNSAPAEPGELIPSGMQGVTSLSPALSHANAADGEGDAVTYDYELYADSQMTVLLDHAEDRPQMPATTSWQVTIALSEDSVYYWRVRGSDPYEDGSWSRLGTFWVNAQNLPPLPFDLISPADGGDIAGRMVTFDWAASTDPDPYDYITYTLFYDDNPAMSSPSTVNEMDSTWYALPNPLEFGTTYYWKVRAKDRFDGQTYGSEIFSFTTIPQGDADGDGAINIADAIYILRYVFGLGPAPEPQAAGDATCDGGVTVADAVYLINYIFKGGPPPGCN